jgi:hypothetical protein
MRTYNSFKYVFPPRPEKKVSSSSLDLLDDGTYIAQPKLNGSLMMLYTDDKDVITMNRHKEPSFPKIKKEELLSLHRGNDWMVLCGELMNKAQRDENGKKWNNKFVVFDVLVYDGSYLLKTTYKERQDLLNNIYGKTYTEKPMLKRISDNCFMVESIDKGFKKTYDKLTKHEMYEGLVLKKVLGKLERGTNRNNNTLSQIKCRKQTKNYSF